MSIPENILRAFERGGTLALLVDLYLQKETIHVTTWTEALRALDPVSGAYAYYSPAPFIIASEDGIAHDPKEVAILQIHLGAWGSVDSTRFDLTQRAQFSELLADIDEYLQRRDPRGRLAVLRVCTPDDLSADHTLFVGLVDDWTLGDDGITFEIAEAKDILEANTYPLSTTCSYSFGDSRCGANRESAENKYSGIADAGSSTTQLVDSSISPNTDGYWDLSAIEFTSGQNDGLARDTATYDHTTGTIVFDLPLENAVATGDRFILRRKCKKTFNHCKQINQDYVRFGGNPFLSDSVQGLYWRGKA